MQKLGKPVSGLLLTPISLNVASQKIRCYCGNVKTKYFGVLKSILFFCLFAFLAYVDVVTVMVWIPENLFHVGRISNLLGLCCFLFFPLSNSNLHLCKAEKKSDQ